MNQKYLVARVGTLGECVIHADAENVASFIARYSRGGDIIMATLHLYPLLTTRGEFIDRCYDQDFLKAELLHQLIPMQMGESEPGEIRYPETREDFQGNPAPIPNWDCSTGHGIFNLLNEMKPNRRWRPAYLKEILRTTEEFRTGIEEKIQRRIEWQEKKSIEEDEDLEW